MHADLEDPGECIVRAFEDEDIDFICFKGSFERSLNKSWSGKERSVAFLFTASKSDCQILNQFRRGPYFCLLKFNYRLQINQFPTQRDLLLSIQRVKIKIDFVYLFLNNLRFYISSINNLKLNQS
jgi:hypothetical protein